MRKVTSTKTRNISFDGWPNLNPITCDIAGVSYCILHIEWMLMMKWTGYIAANWSNYSIIGTNVYALKKRESDLHQWIQSVCIKLAVTLRFTGSLKNGKAVCLLQWSNNIDINIEQLSLWATLVTKTYKTTFFNVDQVWCYRAIHSTQAINLGS